MRMDGEHESSNVEDVRGMSGGGGGFGIGGRGIGLGSVAVALIAGWIFGINPLTILGLMSGGGRRRRAGGAAAGAGAGAATPNDPEAKLRLAGAAQHRGGLDRCLPRIGPDLPAAQAGALPRQLADGLRPGQRGDGSVLLPERPEGLHRPALLRQLAHKLGAPGPVRAGLRDRARGRPPRAEPARHHAEGRRDAQPRQRGAGQCAQRAGRAAGRLLRRRLGQSLAEGAGLAARPGRHRDRAERRVADRRRHAAAQDARHGGARDLHAWHQRAAGELVQARRRQRQHRSAATPSRGAISDGGATGPRSRSRPDVAQVAESSAADTRPE